MASFQVSSIAPSVSMNNKKALLKLSKTKTKTKTMTNLASRRRRVIRAVSVDQSESQKPQNSVDFVFVASVMMPDGTPDVQYRTTCGGQNLRTIMLDANIDLYGPYGRPLLNCAGSGICATCMVEVVEGRELLSPRTDKEKEKLKRKPKNWRLACQATVGKPDSDGVVVIQQLPEWKAHEWQYEKIDPSELL